MDSTLLLETFADELKLLTKQPENRWEELQVLKVTEDEEKKFERAQFKEQQTLYKSSK